jgi:hypothetical protein
LDEENVVNVLMLYTLCNISNVVKDTKICLRNLLANINETGELFFASSKAVLCFFKLSKISLPTSGVVLPALILF